MSDERLRILQMVEEGKISATDAAKLLEALENQPPGNEAPTATGQPRWLRVYISESSGKKVHVNIPARLLNMALRIATRTGALRQEESAEVLQALREALNTGQRGRIVEIVDAEDGDRVEIYLE